MNLILARKTKCAGCKALCSSKKDGYTCSLGFHLNYKEHTYNGTTDFTHPVPAEKCYKPATPQELKKAQELVAHSRRNKNEVAQ